MFTANEPLLPPPPNDADDGSIHFAEATALATNDCENVKMDFN
jgi:hypothetical protein